MPCDLKKAIPSPSNYFGPSWRAIVITVPTIPLYCDAGAALSIITVAFPPAPIAEVAVT